MDATQFQAAVLAWGASVTTLIGVLVGIALTLRGAINQIQAKSEANKAAIAGVAAVTAVHDRQLNGEMGVRIHAGAVEAIAEDKEVGHVG